LVKDGIDPVQTRHREPAAKALADSSTFDNMAWAYLKRVTPDPYASTIEKNKAWLERNEFPDPGPMPIASIKPRDVLAVLESFLRQPFGPLGSGLFLDTKFQDSPCAVRNHGVTKNESCLNVLSALKNSKHTKLSRASSPSAKQQWGWVREGRFLKAFKLGDFVTV
jgi:hypothetical protein